MADLRQFTGAQRAAALMLAMGKERFAPIWEQLTVDEIKEVSAGIASLGRVPTTIVEHFLHRFAGEMNGVSELYGSLDTAENWLGGFLEEDELGEIMSEIRGPSGRTVWDKLANVSETVLASYLKNENPQSVALILQKLGSAQSARVIKELPRDLAVDVVNRMLNIDNVQSDVLKRLENTLRHEFMNNLGRSQRSNAHETLAEMFNSLEIKYGESILEELEKRSPDDAERIRSLMFTFSDLLNLLPEAIQVIIRSAEKRDLTLALKPMPDDVRQKFFSVMTERAAKLLREEIQAIGPVRARDCEDAQGNLVRLAKNLADRGEIVLIDPRNDDSLIL
jgi:flagellar motor switch protein FliG